MPEPTSSTVSHTGYVPRHAKQFCAGGEQAPARAEMQRPMKLDSRPVWAAMPGGEGLALLRHTLPAAADQILMRAKAYYRACA